MLFNNLMLKVAYVLLILILASNYQSVWCQNRIVGGKQINIQNVPYMLYFQVKNTHSCGAAIIGKKWGLTAAHCFDNAKNKEIIVIGGTSNIKKREKSAKIHQVTKYYVHEKYRANASVGYDIAVFKVTPPFKYSKFMKPVKLPENGKSLDETWGQIAGWGVTKTNGTGSSNLLYVRIPKVKTETCKKIFAGSKLSIRNGEICYGYLNGTVTKDSCQGDSGGPLVNSQAIVIGIVSWGIGNCGEYPGVYTETRYFRNWIKNKTGI